MKSLINRMLLKIAQSIDGNNNATSSVRLQSYIILFPIVFTILIFLAIEIWAFIHAIKTDKEYKLSSEIIIVFGMTLSHHLAILFSRTKSQSIAEISGKDKPTKNIDESNESNECNETK